ncbi:MAG TPA: alpha/beta fold hydrolase [Polyangiaceae bacterium]|jgi:4,5:9,10-diseco-3-hydroxy-5,9,17-trioxoandrosta-1(10),2-diene-4-oate hydrolase
MAQTSNAPLPGALLVRASARPGRPGAVSATRHEQQDATVLGGLRLRYIDVRPGEERGPPLVLLHGIASRIEEYDDLVEALRPRRRIIVMDLPGNGYSDKPARAYTLGFLEDAVLGLLDRLDVRSADLAGGSLGGNLTLRLGHREPGRFRRLASWGPAGTWEPKRLLAFLLGLLRPAGGALFWPVVWLQSRFWYHPGWAGRAHALAEAFAHFREIHAPGFVRMYFDLAREQLLTSLFPIAPAIRQPALVVWGDGDHALGMGPGVRRLVELMPAARLSVVQGVGHAVANEAPAELSRRIDGFLAEP